MALGVVLVGPFLAVLDFFVVNIAIPSIHSELGATAGQAELFVAGYGIAYATLLITGGRLGDLRGRRWAFVAGLVGFSVASLLCGAAPSPGWLIAGRIVQGVAAAVMVPQALATMHASFPAEQRKLVFGVYGAVLGLAAVAGQLLAGFLIQLNLLGLGWRAIFLVNVPVGLVAAPLAWALLDGRRGEAGDRLDWTGVVLSSAGLALLVYPLTLAAGGPWSGGLTAMVLAAAVMLAAFAVTQRKKTALHLSPLLDLRLLRQSSFAAGLLVVLVFCGGLASLFLTLTVHLQAVLHLSAARTGWSFAPYAAAFSVSSLFSVRYAAPLGRLGLLMGLSAMLVGLLAVLLVVAGSSGGTATTLLPWALALYGVGQGCAQPLLFNLVLSDVPPAFAGAASGILSTVQQLAAALGVAAIGLVFNAGSGASSGTSGFVHATLVNVILIAAAIGLSTLLTASPAGRARPAAGTETLH